MFRRGSNVPGDHYRFAGVNPVQAAPRHRGAPQGSRNFVCSQARLQLYKRVLDRQCFLASQNANESIDSETGNMQTVVIDKNVTVCLWANFRKNPRWVREKMTIMEL